MAQGARGRLFRDDPVSPIGTRLIRSPRRYDAVLTVAGSKRRLGVVLSIIAADQDEVAWSRYGEIKPGLLRPWFRRIDHAVFVHHTTKQFEDMNALAVDALGKGCVAETIKYRQPHDQGFVLPSYARMAMWASDQIIHNIYRREPRYSNDGYLQEAHFAALLPRQGELMPREQIQTPSPPDH